MTDRPHTPDVVGAPADVDVSAPAPGSSELPDVDAMLAAAATARADRGRAAIAGVLATGVALATGELLAGVSDGIPSPVTAVGSLVIPVVPPALEDWAIATFGTSDKAVLTAGVAVVSLLVGAVIGLRSRRSPGAAVPWFGVFGLLGLFAAFRQPLVSPPLATLSMVAVVAAGSWSLVALLRRAARAATAPVTEDGDVTRRRFVTSAVGAGAGAVVASWVGRRVLVPPAAPVGAPLVLPEPSMPVEPVAAGQSYDAVAGITPIVVPNDEFYRIDTALVVPRIDAADWTLRIHGMVDREIELTYADLIGRDSLIERYVTIACVSNDVGDDLVGNAAWRGVPLRELLDEAGVAAGATQLVGRSIDGWTAGFPTALAYDGRDAMLALGMNGEPLPVEHGYPARLIIPGLYGYVSATKWITEIELTTWEGFDAYWVPRGWAKEGPIKTQSRIDVPRANERIVPGPTVVAGVAWAPTRGLTRVEVQLDEEPWVDAEVTEPLSEDAWVQWRAEVDIPAGVHFLRVRATDGDGVTQTEEVAPVRPDGATGWHTIRVFT